MTVSRSLAHLITPALLAAACLAGPAAAQNRTLTVHPNNRVASLQMTPADYAAWKTDDGFNVRASREALVKDLYASFQDAFDFIFLVLNEDTYPPNIRYAGQLIAVSNSIAGLGQATFNNSANYGSAGRLKSVMALPLKDGIMHGPSLHELMHNWGNFLVETSAFAPAPGPGLYPNFKPHWGVTGGSNRGQLGGFTQDSLQSNVNGNPKRYSAPGFGQNANGGNGIPYTQLELYLMGLIPLSEVDEFDVFRDITTLDFSDPKVTYWEADTRIRYDRARLNALPARSPTYLTSPKEFRLLIVVLCDAPLTQAVWNRVDKQSESLGKPGDEGTYLHNFWEATGGRATLVTGGLNTALKSTAVVALPAAPRLSRSRPGLGIIPVGGELFDVAGRFRSKAPALPLR